MKIRNGFVSNSSSSSFVIRKEVLSPLQIMLIRNHSKIASVFNYSDSEDAWNIDENESYIAGYTIMDNFGMKTYLTKIGVKSEEIKWKPMADSIH